MWPEMGEPNGALMPIAEYVDGVALVIWTFDIARDDGLGFTIGRTKVMCLTPAGVRWTWLDFLEDVRCAVKLPLKQCKMKR